MFLALLQHGSHHVQGSLGTEEGILLRISYWVCHNSQLVGIICSTAVDMVSVQPHEDK